MVMMTGDSERTAKAIAANVWAWTSIIREVLPEDKARFVARREGRRTQGHYGRRRHQ